jgi:hypothetical protein
MFRALSSAIVGAMLFFLLGAGLFMAIKQAWPQANVQEFSTVILTCTTAMGSLITAIAATRATRSADEPAIKKEPKQTHHAVAPMPRVTESGSDRVKQMLAHSKELRNRIERLQSHSNRLRQLYLQERQRHETLKQYARRILATRISFFVAVTFSICHLATGGAQGLIQTVWPLTDVKDPARIAVYFSQSLLLMACAVAVPATFYWSFLNRTGSFDRWHLIKIGCLGLFFSGVISLFSLSPEMIVFIVKGNAKPLEYIHVSYFVYLVACRTIVFPLLGFTACLVVRLLRRRLARQNKKN